MKPSKKIPRYFCLISLLFSSSLLLIFSCAQGRIDPLIDNIGMTEQDIKDSVIKSKQEKEAKIAKKQSEKIASDNSIPRLNKTITALPIPKIGGEKNISFFVTDQVPLRDVLIELGRIAEIDVDIDPKITGGVIINAKNRPLKEVIDRIAMQGNLIYTYKNNVLHFESDKAFSKNYFVDYLSGSTLWDEVTTNIENIFNKQDGASSSPISISTNKVAGILSIYANRTQHKAIQKYLDDVESQSSAQVLIEAKVVEVNLSEKFRAGIDWSKFSSTGNSLTSFDSPSAGNDFVPTIKITSIGLFPNLLVAVDAMGKFGTTKAISSPRIHAMNNQKASLNFAEKLVYFKVESQQSNQGSTTGTAPTTATVTSTKQEENVGVEIEITPSINPKTGEITMNISPKITQKTGEVIDPAASLTIFTTGTKNVVPVVTTRELSTSVKIASGNVIVLGGLMKDNSASNESGIPFLRRIPILGWLFKSVEKSSDISETVIFIKATIINSGTRANKTDQEIHEKYDINRRDYF